MDIPKITNKETNSKTKATKEPKTQKSNISDFEEIKWLTGC